MLDMNNADGHKHNDHGLMDEDTEDQENLVDAYNIDGEPSWKGTATQLAEETQVLGVEDAMQTGVTQGDLLTAKKYSQRTQGYTTKEDCLICDAWMDISQDPVTGAEQKGGILASG